MKRRQAVIGIAVLALRAVSARAQSGKLPRIAVLHAGASNEPASQQREPFERGLRELGWIPGATLTVDYRYAEGSEDRLPELAREIVRSRPEVIVARGPAVVRAVQAATTAIPVVGLYSGDPVADGFIKSLARPGTNMTGVLGDNLTLDAKRLELLKEVVPRAKRIAILANPNFDGAQFEERMASIHSRARALKVRAETFKVTSIGEISVAFAAIVKFKAEALLVRPDPQLIDRSRGEIIALAAKHRLPAVYPWGFFVHSGGLIAYSFYFPWLHSQAAVYASRILKGERPAEMPVEESAKYEMLVNLGTARALGIEIPKTVLFRADQIID